MKIEYKKIASLFVAGLFLGSVVSCNKDEQEYPATVKPVVSLTSTSYTVNEGTDLNITLKSNVAYKTKMDFKLEVISTANTSEDFNFDKSSLNVSAINADEGWGPTENVYKFSFPAFATQANIKLSAILDDLAEGTEKIQFKITPEGNKNGNVDAAYQVFEVNIVNQLKDSFDITLDWNKSFNLGGTQNSLCGLRYDVDILVFDSNNQPFGAGAQTGDCPEHLVMKLADYPNGTYTIVGSLYDDVGVSGAGISPALDFPVKVTYKRGGSSTLDGVFTQSGSGILTSNSTSGSLTTIAKVVVNNGVFTLKKADDTVVASGRSSVYQAYKAAFEARRK